MPPPMKALFASLLASPVLTFYHMLESLEALGPTLMLSTW